MPVVEKVTMWHEGSESQLTMPTSGVVLVLHLENGEQMNIALDQEKIEVSARSKGRLLVVPGTAKRVNLEVQPR